VRGSTPFRGQACHPFFQQRTFRLSFFFFQLEQYFYFPTNQSKHVSAFISEVNRAVVEGTFAVLGSKRLRLSVLGCFCMEGRREKRGERRTHLLRWSIRMSFYCFMRVRMFSEKIRAFLLRCGKLKSPIRCWIRVVRVPLIHVCWEGSEWI